MRTRSMARVGGIAIAALGLTLTASVGTASAAAKPNTVDYFSSGGKKRAMLVFQPRDSARDDERLVVDDLSSDNHYVWTEVYDVTAQRKKGECATSSFKSCAFAIPEGHKVRINVYRLNSNNSDFMGEVLTRSGKLPKA
ncbi:hypothetical protein [Streptomyces ureilyticus]|uniref:Uncharacterized protein n=1 Tax=Streptomyces ureilyticus TaxID=1775131 RepID=A0ABX0DIP9_9ACTN|nr:hypothetical protein [Streptomyces ureilyticus]NGO40634.1 hypothetical protein [Streptomyces ureilyticus]